ncbi:hypothetical protein DF185_12625 [Marinifilum breve]|uniref:STAS/SEC14 domain-containing protein n=1 Tax=Marinifilum breve TaxID=2184082 RepID=A0A2V3ZWP1_9BACT|nr:hypothetical protein [Marinifilum breve]PXY00746.1 hypothetical protein DF185_12625 [Marinifilum breve]
MIKTFFNPKTQILESTYSGKVSLNEIVEYINETKCNPNYPRALKILTYCSDSEMTFGPNDIPKIVEANNQSLAKYDSITDALIVNNPNETALIIFFQMLSENKKYKVDAFSTEEAAMNWLQNSNS